MSRPSCAATWAACGRRSKPAPRRPRKSASWFPATSFLARPKVWSRLTCRKGASRGRGLVAGGRPALPSRRERPRKGCARLAMKILVANLGSTSFKYRLFDMTDERQLARGGIERIGAAESRCFVEIARRAAGSYGPRARPCRGRAANARSIDRSGDRLPERRERSGGDRLQGGAWRPIERRATGRRRTCWRRWRR